MPFSMDDTEKPDESEEPTLYEILLCAPDASEHDLKQAYKQQALHWHPDKNSSPEAEERFKKINEAWTVLSDEHQRAAYDRKMLGGFDDSCCGASQYPAYDANAAREAWHAFMKAEENERRAQQRREKGFLYGVLSLAFWLVAFLLLLWTFASDSALLFPRAFELTNHELSSIKLDLEFDSFRTKLNERHSHRFVMPPLVAASPALSYWLRTSTPYLRISLNATTELRRAPEVGRPKGRGYLLVSQRTSEDIYGRQTNLVSNLLLFFAGEKPTAWPSTTLCARLLKSGSVKHKDWWIDLSRAVGGRLRPFALAIVGAGECEPEFGLPTLAGTTVAAFIAAKASVRVLLGPRPRHAWS